MNKHTIRQRGSIYITVLGTAMIITVIALSAVAAIRVQRRAVDAGDDLAEARLYAKSAVELGMHIVQNDPYWRTKRGSGNWATDVAIGEGTYTITASDPIDGDMADSDTDPVVITGKGVKGAATYLLEVQMESQPGLASLENAMHAGFDFDLDNSTLTSNQAISAHNEFTIINDSHVYADAQAGDKLNTSSGSVFHGTQDASMPFRAMPDSATVLDYYIANGTAINYTDLQTGDGVTDQLDNGDMENGLRSWSGYPNGSVDVVAATDGNAHGGTTHLRIENRAASATGIQQNITARVVNGATYTFAAWVRALNGLDNFTLRVITTNTGGQNTSSTRNVNVADDGEWYRISMTFTASWTGTLDSAFVQISTGSTNNFLVDDVSLIEQAGGPRRIRNVLLSPTNNPYGSNVTNAEGIYVIDCGNGDMFIENCRIVGTLVLRNPGLNTRVRESVCWEPAIENYPALIGESLITIAAGDRPLSEADMGTNFNPAGAPYPYSTGTENADATDAFPSVIRGLVYAKADLILANSPTFNGVVLSNNDIDIVSGEVTANYNAVHLNNPPPGFDAVTRTMTMTPGTWRRVVLP